MCSRVKVEEAFNPWLKDWSFFSIDFDGISWGVFLQHGVLILVFFHLFDSFRIVVELEDRNLNSIFRVINVCGPYTKITPFWEGLCASSVVEVSNIILGGDLNFTLSIREVWGAHP
jgi:hypothetical protein